MMMPMAAMKTKLPLTMNDHRCAEAPEFDRNRFVSPISTLMKERCGGKTVMVMAMVVLMVFMVMAMVVLMVFMVMVMVIVLMVLMVMVMVLMALMVIMPLMGLVWLPPRMNLRGHCFREKSDRLWHLTTMRPTIC